MEDEAVYHGLPRNFKHVSVVVCISAAGEYMTPFFVFSQANDAVQRGLKIRGFQLETDLILKSRTKLYTNAQMFAEYSSMAFISSVKGLRSLEEFAGREAIL
jgi:hypothetical protein